MKPQAIAPLCLLVCAFCPGTGAQTASINRVAEGVDWVPLEHFRDIEPGSALDFSGMGLQDAPAGKYGWLVSRCGHAEFEGRPGVPARFCGVNLCQTANYLAPDEIERATDRLARLGYNAVRLHHHDEDWAENKDAIDRLIAACIRKGIYLTTDLYVSRRIPWRDFGIDRDGDADPTSAKLLMMFTEKGFANWARFAHGFLSHVNPYTGRSLVDEPAMPLLVLVNESSPHSFWSSAKAIPEFRVLWPQWLAEARAENPTAYPTASPEQFPETGGWWDPSPENSAKAAFWAWCCARHARRAKAFLREELGVRAMLTSENNGPLLPPILEKRSGACDYIDVHFYACDTVGASKAARDETGLPLVGTFDSFNPLSATAKGRYGNFAAARVWGLPYTASESAATGPNRFRALHGLAIGALAAVQDWTGLWTFAMAHTREKLLDGGDAAPGRYDLALDPLMQATDRLPQLLFLRGDQTTPTAAFANDFTAAAMRADAEGAALPARPAWAGGGLEWRARLGVSFDGVAVPDGVERISADESAERSRLGATLDTLERATPDIGVSVDEERGTITVSGPRTCGGFVHDGGSFDAGALSATVRGHDALVAASALDGATIGKSSRILAWHLTDLHGDGFEWGGDIVKSSYWPQTGILDWGAPQCMLHAGDADIELAAGEGSEAQSPSFAVYALDTAGRRRAEVPCVFDATSGRLRFTASARQRFGGCIYYEVTRTPGFRSH